MFEGLVGGLNNGGKHIYGGEEEDSGDYLLCFGGMRNFDG